MMETAVAPITLNLVRERFLWDMAKERLPTHRGPRCWPHPGLAGALPLPVEVPEDQLDTRC